MDSTVGSVSKGCFVFNGKRQRAKPDDYFNPSFKSTPCQKQLQIFQKLWDDVHNDIQVLQSDLNTKIFEDLLKFVQTAHAGFSLEAEQKNVPIHEIPTAALITGVNTPDHAVMFHNLVQLLREWVTPLVAVLRAKDCSQLKQTLSKAVAQFMEQPDVHVDSDDEEDNDVTNMSKMTTTLSSLASWYKDKFTQTHSPSKKKRYSPSKAFINEIRFPPLVVVFEDLEGFTPHVLQDFITITSNYLSRLPMVLVFGIATTVTAIHRLLPNAVSSLLCIEKFQAPPSSEYLTQIIDEVLMTGKFPFKLGNKVFQLLLDLFLYHDFSVLNFIRGIQFAMMDHYYSANYSYMCCSLSEAEKQLKKLTSNHMDDIRQIPSFMRYVETQESSKQADLLTDDEYTKEIILKMLTDIQSYHETYFPVLRCLHAAASRLPRHPLGKQIREVYSLSLKENIFETVDYKESMELLRVLSRDELCDCLKRCQELLHNNSNIEDLNMISDKLANYLLHLQDNSKLSEEVTDDNNSLTEEPSEPLFIPKKTDLYSLRKTLQDMEKKRKLSPYEVLRNEIVDYMNDMFRRYLLCPSELPLYEIFYYDSATVIKQQLNAAPRSAINMALSNPSYYLECECCESKSGAITSTMPDTCIAYKLHLECGRLINLYDWMQAFATVLDEDKSQADADEGFDKKPDRIMQARFIRAVSELQFLGFVKPTKRKTDHVARLTWGGC